MNITSFQNGTSQCLPFSLSVLSMAKFYMALDGYTCHRYVLRRLKYFQITIIGTAWCVRILSLRGICIHLP
jgi:hypothetical protein